MDEPKNSEIDWYFVKVQVSATHTLLVPAGNREEALREAYSHNIPTDRLYDIDKEAAICDPTFNEILSQLEAPRVTHQLISVVV